MKAKCLCGDVSLEVEHDKHVHACHCSMCRIWGSGATFSLIAAKPPKIDAKAPYYELANDTPKLTEEEFLAQFGGG